MSINVLLVAHHISRVTWMHNCFQPPIQLVVAM